MVKYAKTMLKSILCITTVAVLSLSGQRDVKADTAMPDAMSGKITLADDCYVNGNAYLTGADSVLDLNGYTLTIKGNFEQKYGTIRVNGGQLIIEGNYDQPEGVLYIGVDTEEDEEETTEEKEIDTSYVSVGGKYFSRYGSGCGHGRLVMTGGIMEVAGNIMIDTDCKIPCEQTGGVLRVGGELSVGANSACNGYNYAPSGDHITEFTSDEMQRVVFGEDKVEGIENHLNYVEQSGTGSIWTDCKTSGFVMLSDITLADYSVFYGARTLDLNGHTLKIVGTGYVEFLGENMLIDVTDANSMIDAAIGVDIPEGTLHIGKGRVKVAGRLRMRYGSGVGHSRLVMDQEGGMLDVKDLTIDTDCETPCTQTEGTLIIRGEMSISPYGYNYAPTGNHVTVFAGDVEHKVTFSDNEKNWLHKVKMEDPNVGAIWFNNNYGTGSSGFTLLSDITATGYSAFSGSRPLILNGHTMTVTGGMETTANAVGFIIDATDAKGVLDVQGELSMPEGILHIGKGTVKAKKLTLRYGGGVGHSKLQMDDAGLLEVSDRLMIDTDVTTALTQTAGTVKIGGELSCGNSGNNYMPSGTHITYFIGETEHKVNFSSTTDKINIFKMDVGGSLKLAGKLNGVSEINGGTMSAADTTIAAVDDSYKRTITALKEGETTLTFQNGEESNRAKLIVGEATSTGGGNTGDDTSDTGGGGTSGTGGGGSASVTDVIYDPIPITPPSPEPDINVKDEQTNTDQNTGNTSNQTTESDEEITLDAGELPKPGLSSVKAAGSKKVKIKIKAVKGAKGYQVQYGTSKKFKGAKSKLTKKTSVTLTNLKKGKKYYIRVRAYTLKGKKKVYGKWGKTASVKIK